MGTKVDYKNNSYFPGYCSMRDLNNDDSSSNSWPLFYTDTTINNSSANAQVLNNGFFPPPPPPPGYDKDSVKQTILQHEAIFKHQVVELHRVYRIQRDMMDDFRRRELQRSVIPLEMSSSSSPVAAPRLFDSQRWRKQYGNGDNSEDCEILDSRPSKVMKRLFDLQLPPDQQFVDSEGENSPAREKLADLNEPVVQVDEGMAEFNDGSSAKSKHSFFFEFQNGNSSSSSRFIENERKASLNVIPESQERKQDLFIDRRLPWLSAQASSSSVKGTTPPGFPSNCRSNHFDLPDLNKVSCDGFFSHEGDVKRPDEDHNLGAAVGLPWLRTKPDQEQHAGNILGFSKSKDEPPPSQRMFDINVAYDSDSEKPTPPKEVDASNSRFLIDLNSRFSEDEDEDELPTPSCRGGAEIDLEILPMEEPEDYVVEEDNSRTVAAEAIVAISTTAHVSNDNEVPPGENSMEDPLSWFADQILTSSSPPPPPPPPAPPLLDEFEMMTLNLRELKEEDYMPKPLIPIPNREEEDNDETRTGSGSSIATRTRRGPGRRGRQRRDFQRDILPGLASLSRHEVREDIQTFGGLMRATGHHQWRSGVTRRTGSGRGRGRRPSSSSSCMSTVQTSTDCTRLIQQMSCADDVWGKTPRRPRRQRSCPQGNNPPPTPTTTAVLLA